LYWPLVIEASSLTDARMRAALEEADAGVDYSEGYQLNPEWAGLVPTKQVGRILTMEEAAKLLQQFGITVAPNQPPGE
jgi:hypothetical protein